MSSGGFINRLTAGQPITWLIWHPHQRLWNWRMVAIVRRVFASRPEAGERAVSLLVMVDSLLLLIRVVLRRLTSGAEARHPANGRPSVLHIDCGPHKEGNEILWMHRWFDQRYDLKTIALEAGGEQFEAAARNLSGIGDLDLRRAAVVGPDHQGDTVELHQGHAGGRGASLFSDRGGTVEQVPAVRLSEILSTISPLPDAVILRMNIEGAESFAIHDLLDSGQDGRIDGYYGMWDDLSKIDPQQDREFRRLLKQHGIQKIPFNERDLANPVRRLAIRTDIETSVRRARSRRRPVA